MNTISDLTDFGLFFFKRTSETLCFQDKEGVWEDFFKPINQSHYISHCSISVVNLNYKTLISMRGMSIHAEGGCSRSL